VALASLPLIAFGAPFIILRNTVRGRRIEGRPIGIVRIPDEVCGRIKSDLP
jgi:hypothetical protein